MRVEHSQASELPLALQNKLGRGKGKENGLHADLANANGNLSMSLQMGDMHELREALKKARTFAEYYQDEAIQKRADPEAVVQAFAGHATPGAIERFNLIVGKLRGWADNPDDSLVKSGVLRLLDELEKLIRE